MIEGRRILLTGGAGFIGTALVRRLCETNHCVVFDLLRRNALGPAGLDKHPNVTLIPGDVRDAAALAEQLFAEAGSLLKVLEARLAADASAQGRPPA